MLVDLINDFNHRINRANRLHCTLLNCRNLIANVFGRFLRLSGEFLNFSRDNRETLTRFTCSRRLNRCVQCKKVGLLCNRVDILDDLPNLDTAFTELGNDIGRILSCARCFARLTRTRPVAARAGLEHAATHADALLARPAAGRWLYALLAAVDEPLLADTAAALTALLRAASGVAAAPHAPPHAALLAALLAHHFGQRAVR